MRGLKIALVLILLFAVRMEARSEGVTDLKSDSRLTAKIELAGDTQAIGTVIRLLSERTKVDLFVQGDLLRRPVAIAVRGRAAHEVLDNLATLFGGSWLKRGDAYLL